VNATEHLAGCDGNHGPRQRCNVPPTAPSTTVTPARPPGAGAFRLSRARFVGVLIVVVGAGALVSVVAFILTGRTGDTESSRSIYSRYIGASRAAYYSPEQVDAFARAELGEYRHRDVICSTPTYSAEDAFWTIDCEATQRECSGLEPGDDRLVECLRVEECGQTNILVRDHCRDVRISDRFYYDDLEGELHERWSEAATRYAE
jgi:hypothetical protein